MNFLKEFKKQQNWKLVRNLESISDPERHLLLSITIEEYKRNKVNYNPYILKHGIYKFYYTQLTEYFYQGASLYAKTPDGRISIYPSYKRILTSINEGYFDPRVQSIQGYFMKKGSAILFVPLTNEDLGKPEFETV